MRILYISHLHPPKDEPLENVGGMQNVSVQMVHAMKRRDDVEMETIILNTSWKLIGIKTFFFLVSLLWRIPATAKKFNPDVILFSSMVTAGVLPFMIRQPKAPCVTINHGQDVTLPFFIYQWYIKYVFRKLQGVISVSSATRQACIDRGMDPEIGVALPNGFDMSVLKKLPEKEEARKILEEEFNVDLSDKKLLLTVGRQVKRKGHQWFIDEVFHKIDKNTIYLIIGDGPENQNIQKARERSSEKERIIIAGKQPESILNAAYAGSDLFIMPNIPVEGDMEGFGIVLLEANRAGVPAITADLEGMKDVIEPGVNGYRVPHSDAESFSKKVNDVLKNNLQELSISAEKYVRENFNWDTVVNRYISFLKSVH
ncbi:glycosyltransferase family 4 protein [Rhodohalobacter halophilus]|uniref:glycosyltransferase family 4 protein n=1 Tax=Rhodohalobacter halophilus TaxID=1812810 RepID=UPI001FE173D4|nr:glycosyltransferase family 4 protein [Rhodohalobacter halophilus]